MRPHSYQPPEDGLPPTEVRILDLRGEAWPDSPRKVRVHLELTPFQERPNLEVSITAPDGSEATSITIIESIDMRMTFTLHLRGEESAGPYQLHARVLYPEQGMVDESLVSFVTDRSEE
jgi:hypothetical protein